ncbi:MCE-family protein MCE1A [Mycolicibacterium moriokaense]|uniref:Virulence factor Mce family protein n=1 Tax=Mycolicibacterium moriokaense TaxID=39691 RepID=A0AAD1H969_9MYCO|nr:MCE family protein [Mycolicibacterium moriokaense]MCV7040869.1 MCE family protein [Mycolicibacterium moriokaense]ORB21551.1 MCE-family protein MCE1A [Mycolicibacterium moriokaense]BBX00426.1 virulence factor Mce family protein [Mycolicibacterium moriokaense]
MSVDRHNPPYRTAGVLLLVIATVAAGLLYLQFRGDFIRSTELTLLSPRAGLVVEPGAKVTYNGVEIGRVGRIGIVDVDGAAKARLSLDVDPDYLKIIPVNVIADIQATTVFGNKYISLSSPDDPSPQHVSSDQVIDVSSVSTEFNTLFETVLSLAEQVDPIKLNQTLTATAEALTGLGDRFGESLTNGNAIIDDLNARMPQIRQDTRLLADLVDVYADASPDLWGGLTDAVTTARTFNAHRSDIDAALMSALGFADAAADTFDRGGPYFVRAAADLVATSALFDYYSPQLFCTLRNYAEIEEKVAKTLGGNGFSLATSTGTFAGAGNPYIYPDNLPRVNARGGPEGRPGCWQKISRELWPAPYLVMDTGASIAPYNHAELGQPILIEYVWGRQVGELTINP